MYIGFTANLDIYSWAQRSPPDGGLPWSVGELVV
jgi:hypothetical protein